MKFESFINSIFPKISFYNSEYDTNRRQINGKYSKDNHFDNIFIKYDYSDIKSINRLASWPPNLFIVLYSILEYTDKYRLIVSPQDHFVWGKEDVEEIKILAQEWEFVVECNINRNVNNAEVDDLLNKIPNLVKLLADLFNSGSVDLSIYDVLNRDLTANAFFKVLLSIDEFFSDYADRKLEVVPHLDAYLETRRLIRVAKNKHEADNLADNHGMYGFVAFKSQVPQAGLTLNNLTQKLTVIKPTVKPKVIIQKNSFRKTQDKKSYNLLILPWPLKVDGDSFKQVTPNNNQTLPDKFGFFSYEPNTEIDERLFLSVLFSAIERMGYIDIIVFPECSMSENQFSVFESILFDLFGKHSPKLLSGVYGKDSKYSKNSAKLAFIDDSEKMESFEQKKHHRWYLDESQLVNYELCAYLDPGKKWWENIRVGRRQLITLQTKEGLKLCPLICEDLARQEPVAQAVRAIGPNLIISLLLDGPQIEKRWPGKYASVFAEDPGSSVLSVTCLGMTKKSVGSGFPASSEVALWSEPGQGSETIKLNDGSVGIVMALELKDEMLWSIDGRSKNKPVLRKKYHYSIKSNYERLGVEELKNKLKQSKESKCH